METKWQFRMSHVLLNREWLDFLEQMELEKDAKRKVKTYSGGMKRRLGIAQTLLNDLKLIVLDEPTAGLHPKERVRFLHIFEQLGKQKLKSHFLISTKRDMQGFIHQYM